MHCGLLFFDSCLSDRSSVVESAGFAVGVRIRVLFIRMSRMLVVKLVLIVWRPAERFMGGQYYVLWSTHRGLFLLPFSCSCVAAVRKLQSNKQNLAISVQHRFCRILYYLCCTICAARILQNLAISVQGLDSAESMDSAESITTSP